MKHTVYRLFETSRRLPSSMTADDEAGQELVTRAEIKVYTDRVEFEYTDDNVEYAPVDITGTEVGQLLLKAAR
jgi:hypothetical protein